MKNFLAIDTSCDYFTAILSKNGEIYTCFLPDCAMKHSVSLMPAVDELLKKAEMTLDECDYFAAVVGAGSFTGIRIGVSAVKGMCLAFSKPALPITSFDVAAYNAIDRKILCLVDALHDSYYVCGYEDGKVVYPPAYLSEEEVLKLSREYALYACAPLPISEKANVTLVDPVKGLERAAIALAKQDRFGDLTALYVRKSSAELNLEGK
ncbi:MAG: tRNA (adenosine(37)-N6)-threonylcarbamoyltransferase complex dimerization subunit type 1 TsaB [Clostridia bacterium]|nr:tRNA (adenosine(37)-N6)-threonylcarbamoyltransferase complex dimerization subunit type 1 TsaB [Clostridia bacterium]